jgi:uncharacterized protein YeeX (DUF496 family)
LPFEKGHKLATGRPKGSPNKSTQEIRDAFQCFVENNVGNFEEWIARVAQKNPAKAIELINNLSEYILPKLSRQEVKAEIKDDRIDTSKLSDETLKRLEDELNSDTDTSGGS